MQGWEESPGGESACPRWRVARYPYETGVNPYQRLFYEALGRHGVELAPDRPFSSAALAAARRDVDVLHFHWRLDRLYDSRPTHTRVVAARLRLALARALGYRIVWTIHELASRERPGGREPMADELARTAHVLLCHDPDLADRAAAELGIERDRIDVIPHGPLAPAYPPAPETRAHTRARLGLADGDVVFLAFGAIRQYKELDLVLDAFGRLQESRARLVIAGRCYEPVLSKLLETAAAADPRLVVVEGHVPAKDVRALFGACDVAVLGRRDGWTSGALVLALSLGLPAVVADRPAYVRLIAHGRAGWAFDPAGGAGALAAALQSSFETPAAERAAAGAVGVASTAESTWEPGAELLVRRLEELDEMSRGSLPLEPVARDPVVLDA